MPKMKTHSSAKKRFSLTGTGKVKTNHANKSHRLRKRDKSRKRKLTWSTIVDVADAGRVKRMLCVK
ncbi:MAG: 50S ribosomal protein L35 [Saprospiraceae bacterium]|nr:50S ribosomal protein L35 [Saprospiraceae bacterium]